jgi:hypothetical protein
MTGSVYPCYSLIMSNRWRSTNGSTAEQSLQVPHAQALASEKKAKQEADAAGFMLNFFLTDGDIGYGREELFGAARRSRARAYLADDDHGPLALQEILLAGCPTVGVRTGASFVRTGETGVVVGRLPPGRQCAESDDEVRALTVLMKAIREAQSMDRHRVRDRAAEEFDSDRIVDAVVDVLIAAMPEPI